MSAVTSLNVPAEPSRLAGLPLSIWAFGLRTWAAMMLAMYAAFWLQLGPESYDAAVTVSILAQPMRGQALQKGAYRLLATVIGTGVSLAIVGAFNEVRDLYIVACAAWLAACVYVSTCYDGFRAYGAVLSGYTVSFIAIANVDAPQQAFALAMNRAAAIACGIAAVALVSDVFAAPHVYPLVRRRLRRAHDATRALVADIVGGRDPGPDEVLAVFGEIVDTRPQALLLPSEGPAGGRRGAAARSAIVGMIRSIAAARGSAALGKALGDDAAERVRGLLGDGEDGATALREEARRAGASPNHIMLARCALDLVEEQGLSARELDAMEAARRAERRVRLPVHRDKPGAALLATRVFVMITASGFLLPLTSWPQISGAWVYIGLLGGLVSMQPDPARFAKIALITIPSACVVVGVMEFLVLDGTDSFPLLAVAMAPPVLLGCALVSQAQTRGFGALGLVFLILIYRPTNPPSYSSETFLEQATFAVTAALLLAAFSVLVPRASAGVRRRWMIRTTYAELAAAAAGRSRRAPDETTYLMAERTIQLARLGGGTGAARRRRLWAMILMSNLTTFSVRGHRALDGLAQDDQPLAPIAAARDALAHLEADRLTEAATAIARLMPSGERGVEDRIEAVAALQFMATRIAGNRSLLAHLRRGLVDR